MQMLPCAYKELFGIDCPTCGAQRSFVLLLEGDLPGSFFMYPPLIPVLILAMLWGLTFFKKGIINSKFLKNFSWTVLSIVIANYIVHFFI